MSNLASEKTEFMPINTKTQVRKNSWFIAKSMEEIQPKKTGNCNLQIIWKAECMPTIE